MPMGLAAGTSGKAPSMLKSIYRFYICSHPDNIFFTEVLVFFTKAMLNRILHLLQQHVLLSVSPKLAYLQPRTTFTNRKHLAREMNDRTQKQLESSSSCSRRFPGVYRLSLKETWVVHSSKHGPVPLFLRHQAQNDFIIRV